MPTSASSASDSDSDNERDTSLVLDRNIVSSTASLEPLERLEALQRQNTDLGRKLMEAERTLQNRLAEHESELEDMQGKLEEMRSELSATKREEKELRSKEVNRFRLLSDSAILTGLANLATKYHSNLRSRARSFEKSQKLSSRPNRPIPLCNVNTKNNVAFRKNTVPTCVYGRTHSYFT